jgi:ribosomal protein L7/L12
MKLDKIKFAKLVAHCVSNGMSAGEWEVEQLDSLTDINIPEPKSGMASAEDVDRLLFLMTQGTQKIEAIKCYRNMTGAFLKEAKDAVEKHWVSKLLKEGATLGDILDTAGRNTN